MMVVIYAKALCFLLFLPCMDDDQMNNTTMTKKI